MIRITVELVSARTGGVSHLGTACISNDGSGTNEVCDYDFKLSKPGRPDQVWKRGRVTGFKRLKLGAWDLLYLALRAAVGYRNADAGAPLPVIEELSCAPAPPNLHCCGEPLHHLKIIDCEDEGAAVMDFGETDEEGDECYQCRVCHAVYEPPATPQELTAEPSETHHD